MAVRAPSAHMFLLLVSARYQFHLGANESIPHHQLFSEPSLRLKNGGFQCLNGGCAMSASSLISMPRPGSVGTG